MTFRSENVGKVEGDSKVICTVEDVHDIINNNSMYLELAIHPSSKKTGL